MRRKCIGPHTIRHTTAVHLLRAGVDINTIRAWLGHVSLDTTNIYAEVDLEMKAKALAKVDVSDFASRSLRRPLIWKAHTTASLCVGICNCKHNMYNNSVHIRSTIQ